MAVDIPNGAHSCHFGTVSGTISHFRDIKRDFIPDEGNKQTRIHKVICPYCNKENTLERYENDPILFGCTNCHGTYSEPFLLGYIHGWIDRETSLKNKEQSHER